MSSPHVSLYPCRTSSRTSLLPLGHQGTRTKGGTSRATPWTSWVLRRFCLSWSRAGLCGRASSSRSLSGSTRRPRHTEGLTGNWRPSSCSRVLDANQISTRQGLQRRRIPHSAENMMLVEKSILMEPAGPLGEQKIVKNCPIDTFDIPPLLVRDIRY